jgi:hypothetical protein
MLHESESILLVTLPAEVGEELVQRGFATLDNSGTRDVRDVGDAAISVVGSGSPMIVVAIAKQATSLAMKQMVTALARWWKQRGGRNDETLTLELRRNERRTMIRIDASGTNSEQAVRQLLTGLGLPAEDR